jgi:hypothetical protein
VFFIKHLFTKARVAAADKKYDNYAFVDAIKTYERVAEKGYKSLICSKIGKRLFQWELEKAAQWYGELFMTSEVEPAYYYRYAQSLRSYENDKANQIMEKFDQMSGNDSRGNFCEKRNYMDAIRLIQEDIEDAGINSPIQIMELLFIK